MGRNFCLTVSWVTCNSSVKEEKILQTRRMNWVSTVHWVGTVYWDHTFAISYCVYCQVTDLTWKRVVYDSLFVTNFLVYRWLIVAVKGVLGRLLELRDGWVSAHKEGNLIDWVEFVTFVPVSNRFWCGSCDWLCESQWQWFSQEIVVIYLCVTWFENGRLNIAGNGSGSGRIHKNCVLWLGLFSSWSLARWSSWVCIRLFYKVRERLLFLLLVRVFAQFLVCLEW